MELSAQAELSLAHTHSHKPKTIDNLASATFKWAHSSQKHSKVAFNVGSKSSKTRSNNPLSPTIQIANSRTLERCKQFDSLCDLAKQPKRQQLSKFYIPNRFGLIQVGRLRNADFQARFNLNENETLKQTAKRHFGHRVNGSTILLRETTTFLSLPGT